MYYQWGSVWILVEWARRRLAEAEEEFNRVQEESLLQNCQRVWRDWKFCAQKQPSQLHPPTSWFE